MARPGGRQVPGSWLHKEPIQHSPRRRRSSYDRISCAHSLARLGSVAVTERRGPVHHRARQNFLPALAAKILSTIMPGERVPFGMFYVEVDPESTAEKILAIAAMAPYFIMCALTTLIVRCRELLVCSWLVGHLLNEALNFVLKRTLKERRPPGAPSVG